MSHFAKIVDNKVAAVIVAEQAFIDTLVGEEWVQTSYNTRAGVHYGADGAPDGGTPLRKNYARVNGIYDRVLDAFYAPSIYPSWALNVTSCTWEPPTPYPTDGINYRWDEPTLSWVALPPRPTESPTPSP